MVRPHRVEYEGAYYHVMNRGRARQTIFHGAGYYADFLTTLGEFWGQAYFIILKIRPYSCR